MRDSKGRFIKGHAVFKGHGMLGKKHSIESRKKMSLAQKGNPWSKINGFQKGNKLTEEHKRIISIRHSKENNFNWKGGITPPNKLERIKFQRTIQKEVFKRDNYTCQICNCVGGILHADHIQQWSEYVTGRFDINNIRTLCRECHYFVTFGRNMPKGSKWGTNKITNTRFMG
jgi:hypothetical protein